MTGLKTNERPGTRAVLKHSGVSAYKAREVLNLIRGKDVQRASEILEYCDREVATVIGKVLASAAANAFHNDGLDPEELFVSACYADEGTTLKRWRPRARGRATRIRKRTCHVTVIVSRMPEDILNRRRARIAAEAADRRARRVAGARRQGRLASRGQKGADTGPDESVDEQVLEIVAAGDTGEGTDLDAAVEQALAADEESDGDGDLDSDGDLDDDEQAEADDAVATDAQDDAEGDDAAGDEETSD
jgi:large subunit ribosomal protein L22